MYPAHRLPDWMLSHCKKSLISNCSRDRCSVCFPLSVQLLCTSCSACPLPLQARETGICPVREELYAQCFDELIREVTINCAERGLLLLRVRDEMHMTIAAYQVGWLCSGQHKLGVFPGQQPNRIYY